MIQTTKGKSLKKKLVVMLACMAMIASLTLTAMAAYGPVSQWTNTITGTMTGNAGTSADPYTVLLSDTTSTKITWKAFESIYGSYSTSYWQGTSTGTGLVATGNYSPSYKWNFYGGNVSGYVQQPYYTDIALLDTAAPAGYDTLRVACATKFPGPIDVSVKVSDVYTTATSVTVTYVTETCDGSLAHATAGAGDLIGEIVPVDPDYLDNFANTFTSGTYSVDANGYITIPALYHGGDFTLSAS